MTRSVFSIARSLGVLSRRWLNRQDPFRNKALKRLVGRSGFDEAGAQKLLDGLFRELTEPKLLKLLKAELGDPRVLDGFQRSPVTGLRHRAQGPKRITHFFAGNVPNPAIISFILGMLLKSENTGKPSSRDEGILDIYLESLRAHDPKLGRMNRLLKSSDREQAMSAARSSQLVVAYGDNETLRQIRSQVPAGIPFMGYGHKVSVGVYMKESLTSKNMPALSNKTAKDIWMMDQRGCLSPTAIYLERGGPVSPLEFCRHVTKILSKKGRWTTLFESRPGKFPLGSDGRVIYFKAFKKIDEVCRSLEPYSRSLQAVSLEVKAADRIDIAEKLSRLGVNRICRAGRLQFPPITWHHDGLPNLAHWVKWTDLES